MSGKSKTPPKQLSLRVFSDLNERSSHHDDQLLFKSQSTSTSASNPQAKASSANSRREASDADMAVYLAIAERYLKDI